MESQLESRWLPEIREVNLSYLMLAQGMIRADKANAMFCLGLSEEVADIVADLGPGQLLKIASGNLLLAEHGRRQAGADGNAQRLHASILMSGNLAEAR
jgi:flagellar transcriptional activator FlhD